MTQLKLVSNEVPAARKSRTRPITAYYFKKGQLRPLRVSRSTSAKTALKAIIGRIVDGEPIGVAEVVGTNGKLLHTVTVHYRRITIK